MTAWIALLITVAAPVLAVFWTNASWMGFIRFEVHSNPDLLAGGLRSRSDLTLAASLYAASCIAGAWALARTLTSATRGN